MKPKTHKWTEAEAEQLVRTLQSMRDALQAMSSLASNFKDCLIDLHGRLIAAESWIEQHKKEAAAFKAQSQQPTIPLIDRELLFKQTTIQAPPPMENGPNVVHYRKWSDLHHKTETDLGGEA